MTIANCTEKLNRRSGEPQAYSLIRTLGSNAFTKLGWPTKKLENWRYSPVGRLQEDFIPQIELEPALIDQEWLSSLIPPNFHTLIFNNGRLAEVPKEIESQIEIYSVREALQRGLLDSKSFEPISDSLEALSLSLFDQGTYLRIKDQAVIAQPILYLHLHGSNVAKSLFHSRFVIEAGQSSSCTIIESHILKNEQQSQWLNTSTTLRLEEKAHLHLIQWAEVSPLHQHTARTQVNLQSETFLHLLSGALSAGWSRNDIAISANGNNAEIYAHGLGFSRGAGVVDQQTNLIFKGPNNKADQICKNLLLDNSRAIFNGRIQIQPGAQKTDSSQLHQSLLLSAQAEVDTKPELEIYADDVKATHGATIGQLSADEVFYFQSRGIKRERAHALLCQAFLMDLCERLSELSLQSFLKTRIEAYWKKETL